MNKQEEREFDEEFKDLSHVGCDNSLPCGTVKDDVKSFISNLTKKREIKLIEEVERLIEGMKNRYKGDGLIGKREFLYNQAMSDLGENLKKLKGK